MSTIFVSHLQRVRRQLSNLTIQWPNPLQKPPDGSQTESAYLHLTKVLPQTAPKGNQASNLVQNGGVKNDTTAKLAVNGSPNINGTFHQAYINLSILQQRVQVDDIVATTITGTAGNMSTSSLIQNGGILNDTILVSAVNGLTTNGTSEIIV